MKYLVLGLLSLALLGFVYAQNPSSGSRAMAYNNTSNTTRPSNNNNNNITGAYPISNQSTANTGTTMMATRPTTMTGTGGMATVTTKNGQSHIFTSVCLLFGSFVLQALWQ